MPSPSAPTPAQEARLRAVERTIDEGLLIALAATRMAVKNQIIVAALRHYKDYRAEDHVPLARHQLDLLIRENEIHGERVRSESLAALPGASALLGASAIPGAPAIPGHVSGRAVPVSVPGNAANIARLERARLELLERVYEGLAVALRAEATNEDTLLDLVDAARRDAWQEVGEEVRRKVASPPDAREDADYERQREGRLQEFVYIDLAGLLLDD